MEEYRGDDEEAEHDDLHEQTCNDDLLAQLVHIERAARLDTATASLQGKGHDVAGDEYTGDPVHGQEGEVLAPDSPYEAGQDHIDRCGVEGGGDED